MKKTLLKISLGIAALSGVAFMGYKGFRSSIFYLEKINYSYSEISEVPSSIQSSYTEFLKPQIEKKMKSNIGKSIWDIDIFQLEKNLESLSWVKNVVISRQFPNELFVEVEPKIIVANIMKSPSKVQPVAFDSSLLAEVEITKAPLVPILAHNIFSSRDDLRKRALQLLRELPREGTFSYNEISEVYPFKSGKQNDEFQVLLKKSKALVLINTENVPLKAARISKVIDYMDPAEMKGRVIDSNFSKKVLVRPRNHR